jgi:hypothetical protein
MLVLEHDPERVSRDRPGDGHDVHLVIVRE